MGFDQYHEPPEELPAETRTFARLCASLTEEAEAIGWYEQRLAVEPDPRGAGDDGRRPGRGVQALRDGPRVPPAPHAAWREIAQGVLFQDGDIVEHGEEAEAEADGGRRRRGEPPPRTRDGSLGIGSLRERDDEPSAARARADLRRRLEAARRGGARAAAPALAARRLVDFAGPHGWEHSATNLGRVEESPPRSDGVRPGAAGCCRWSSCARRSRSRGGAARRRPRGRDVDFDALDVAARQHREAENAAVFHGWARPGSRGIAGRSPHDADRRAARKSTLSALRRGGGRAAAAQRVAALRARAGPRGLHARGRDGRARRLPAVPPSPPDPRGPARLGARDRGRDRGQPARRRLPIRVRPGRRGRLRRRTTRTPSACTSRSRSASGSRPRRPRS